jgi:hypothetical protein
MYYKITYIPIIMYGCEPWPLSSKHNSQLHTTEMRYLRKIEGKTKRDMIRNQTVRMGLGIIPLKEIIELAQLRWFGHVVRIGDLRYTKMAWQARIQGKRPKGRPQETCEGGIPKILKGRGIEWNRVRAITQVCETWKALCKPPIPASRRANK